MAADRPIVSADSNRLQSVQRFLLGLVNRDAATAAAELSTTATLHVPGRAPLAGAFRGNHEIIAHFQRVFEVAPSSEAFKWADWMVGTDLVSALVEAHLQSGLMEWKGRLLFVFAFNPSGRIREIELFLEDQDRFDQFFTQLPTAS